MNCSAVPQPPAASEASTIMASSHADTLREIAAAIDANHVVVVGMAQNPFVKKARQALAAAGIDFQYLEYGSYLSEWKTRLAIKIWTGWPTFPQVFVDGKLIGGESLTKAAIANGSLSSKKKASEK